MKCELLAPVGDFRNLRAAIDAGADAVYFGVKGFNMRDAARNFNVGDFGKIRKICGNKKMYLTLNVVMYDDELKKIERIVKAAKKYVDAIICWDMSVLGLAKEMGLRIHLSTQASVSNIEALKFYHKLGVRRVILARECTLADIKQITKALKNEKIDCQIETFIHGAMCISVSGRCFLSLDSHGRSANPLRGTSSWGSITSLSGRSAGKRRN